jgi:hypothetical protein
MLLFHLRLTLQMPSVENVDLYKNRYFWQYLTYLRYIANKYLGIFPTVELTVDLHNAYIIYHWKNNISDNLNTMTYHCWRKSWLFQS